MANPKPEGVIEWQARLNMVGGRATRSLADVWQSYFCFWVISVAASFAQAAAYTTSREIVSELFAVCAALACLSIAAPWFSFRNPIDRMQAPNRKLAILSGLFGGVAIVQFLWGATAVVALESLPSLAVIGIMAWSEEVFFRGALLRWSLRPKDNDSGLQARRSRKAAALRSQFLFAVIHLPVLIVLLHGHSASVTEISMAIAGTWAFGCVMSAMAFLGSTFSFRVALHSLVNVSALVQRIDLPTRLVHLSCLGVGGLALCALATRMERIGDPPL